jgi:hypothetical protein
MNAQFKTKANAAPVTPAMVDMLRRSGDNDYRKAEAGMAEVVKALETPLRKGVMSGDIVSGIFEVIRFAPGQTVEFPLDWLAPGTEKDFVAYTIPNQGRIPERHIEGDYVMVPTYDVGNSIDWLLKYARDARWDIVGRAMQVLESGFVKKQNDDGWHLLLSAGIDRNIMVFDGDAAAGQFTKRLVSLMKLVMRRNGGGNSNSLTRRTLTDMYVSPENIEDMRNWGVDQVDEVTRREIFLAEDGTGVMSRIYGVFLHDLDELGEGQEYQSFFETELGGSLASGDRELVVGLDLTNNASFVMPVRADIQVFNDPVLHRQRRQGVYAWAEHGFGALDNRYAILGSN